MTDFRPQARTLAEALEQKLRKASADLGPFPADYPIGVAFDAGKAAAFFQAAEDVAQLAAALASHSPAEPGWVDAVTEACLHYDMTQAEAQSVVARARRRCAERSSAPFNSSADSSSERGDAFTGERASGEEGGA